MFHELQTLHSAQQPALIQRLKHLFYCCCHSCLIASHDSEGCTGIHNPPLTSRQMGPSTVLIGDMLCAGWHHASAKMLPIFLGAVRHETLGHLLSTQDCPWPWKSKIYQEQSFRSEILSFMNCFLLIYFLTGSFYDLEKEYTQITGGHERNRTFSIIMVVLSARSLDLDIDSPRSF